MSESNEALVQRILDDITPLIFNGDAPIERDDIETAIRSALSQQGEAVAPNGYVLVGRSELSMVRNALARDAEERPARGEMLAELDASIERGASLSPAPQPQGEPVAQRLFGELVEVWPDDRCCLVGTDTGRVIANFSHGSEAECVMEHFNAAPPAPAAGALAGLREQHKAALQFQHENSTRIQQELIARIQVKTEKLAASEARVGELEAALRRIGTYPRTPSDELGYSGCRHIANAALSAPSNAAPASDVAPERVGFDSRFPADMCSKTAQLVERFAVALAEKLHAADQKYGHGDSWACVDWENKCRSDLLAHIAKGDPRDVAAYCAFMWHHGWSTASPTPAADTERDVRQRAIGRAEALSLILNKHPETFGDEMWRCLAPCGPDGEWDTGWNEEKLRAFLRVEDSAWSLLEKTEDETFTALAALADRDARIKSLDEAAKEAAHLLLAYTRGEPGGKNLTFAIKLAHGIIAGNADVKALTEDYLAAPTSGEGE